MADEWILDRISVTSTWKYIGFAKNIEHGVSLTFYHTSGIKSTACHRDGDPDFSRL